MTTNARIQINAIDTNRVEPAGFFIDRPAGGADWLLVHLTAPARFRIRDGLYRLGPGACVLYPPGEPQWFTGDGGRFANDFIHMQGPAVAETVRAFDLPVATPFHPRAPALVAAGVGAIMLELARRERHWQDAVALRFRELCLGLARALVQGPAEAANPRRRELLERCRHLRARVLATLDQPWSVPLMAGQVHLSRTRFSVLYRQFFGISPGEDLIRERLRRAQWLLLRGNHTIAEAASESGFDCASHFSRLFRARLGISPRAYMARATTGRAADRPWPG